MLATPDSEATETVAGSFPRRHGRKLVALAFWLALLGGYGLHAYKTGLSPFEVVDRSMLFMHAGIAGPLLYVALFAARPLVLFPASVLAVAGGFVFGPVLGSLLALAGGNASASVAYTLGRYFGKESLHAGRSDGRIQRYAEKVRANGFESVLLVQFTYLPFDLVNYLAGFLRVGWKPFALATAVGSLPGTVSFALLGASFEMDFTTGAHALDPWALAASVALFAASMAVSSYLKNRDKEEDDDATTDA